MSAFSVAHRLVSHHVTPAVAQVAPKKKTLLATNTQQWLSTIENVVADRPKQTPTAESARALAFGVIIQNPWYSSGS